MGKNRKQAKQSVGKGKKVVPSTTDSKRIKDDKLMKSIRMKEINDEMKKTTKVLLLFICEFIYLCNLFKKKTHHN